MVRNPWLAAAAVAVSAATAVSAHANPIFLGYSLDGGTTITTVGSSGNDGTAGTGGSIPAGNFTIQISGTGQGAGALTSLFSNTLAISSASAGSIVLYASETNNTSRAGTFTTGFGNNSLSTVSVIETTYLGLSNTAFSVASPSAMSMMTVAPGSGNGTSTVSAPTLPALYSLTESYAITFAAGGGRVDATLGVVSTAAAVPEPMSMALLGTGLVGLGLVRNRKRS